MRTTVRKLSKAIFSLFFFVVFYTVIDPSPHPLDGLSSSPKMFLGSLSGFRASQDEMGPRRPVIPVKEPVRKLVYTDDPAQVYETGPASVEALRDLAGQGFARIIIDLSSPVKHLEQSNGSSLSIFLRPARISSGLAYQKKRSEGLIKQITAAQLNSDTIHILVEMKALKSFNAFTLTDPDRLVVDILGADSFEQDIKSLTEPLAQPGSAAATGDGEVTYLRALALKIKRIVIDPGHGGHDLGAVGPDGLFEKDVVLDVARQLRDQLQQQLGIEVVMTRDRDVFIPLEKRTEIANANKADLFISIHANASLNHETRGVETYFLSLTTQKDELETAARENATTDRTARELQTLLQSIALNDKVIESRDFARIIQRNLVGGLKEGDQSIIDRGVKKAPFIVLIGAQMPSVLVEISFISNPGTERALNNPAYRRRIANSLLNGVRSYIDTLSKADSNYLSAAR